MVLCLNEFARFLAYFQNTQQIGIINLETQCGLKHAQNPRHGLSKNTTATEHINIDVHTPQLMLASYVLIGLSLHCFP
jgi:hypothetical protein